MKRASIIAAIIYCFCVTNPASAEQVKFDASSYICEFKREQIALIMQEVDGQLLEITRNISVQKVDNDTYLLENNLTKQIWLTKENRQWLMRETDAGKLVNEYSCWDADFLISEIATVLSRTLHQELVNILELRTKTISQQNTFIEKLKLDTQSHLAELSRANDKILVLNKSILEKTASTRQLNAKLALEKQKVKDLERQLQTQIAQNQSLQLSVAQKDSCQMDQTVVAKSQEQISNLGNRLNAALSRAGTEERKRRNAEEKLRILQDVCDAKID